MPMIPLERARWTLGILWFIGSGLLFVLLIVQSLAGVYEARVQDVWGWALPNLIPTLSLMIGVFAAGALSEQAESDAMWVRRPFFRLSLAMSVFYLLAVAAAFFAQPFLGAIQGAQGDPMTLFNTSNLWLGPLQGLVAAMIGALFVSKNRSGTP